MVVDSFMSDCIRPQAFIVKLYRYLFFVSILIQKIVSHQFEKMPRRIEDIQRDIDAAIEACECFVGESPRETRYEMRHQMARLQSLSFEVKYVILTNSIFKSKNVYIIIVNLFIYFYSIYFKLKELDKDVAARIAALQLRFEHSQANGLPSRCLYQEIQTLKREEITIQASRVDVLSYLLDYYR